MHSVFCLFTFFAKVLELFGKFEAEIHIQSSLDYSTSADSFWYWYVESESSDSNFSTVQATQQPHCRVIVFFAGDLIKILVSRVASRFNFFGVLVGLSVAFCVEFLLGIFARLVVRSASKYVGGFIVQIMVRLFLQFWSEFLSDMLSNSSLHFYWDFLVAFFVDPIVTVVMVFVLIVNIAAGVLGVIARLAVYSFVVVSFLYWCP